MHKYDVWFCHCGTIQVMPMEYYDWLQKDYKHRCIYRVCQNCGKVMKVWLDEYDDSFSINACNVDNFEVSEKDLNNCRIIFNEGYRVPMVDGSYAEYHMNGQFYNSVLEKRVDTEELIREVKDKEILESIASYVSGINWKNTEYEMY